ncbi:hypothetical protein [Phenylobacterium sp.]|jgi:hypothetical protein
MNGEDKLARLVAQLQKAVIAVERNRGRSERPEWRRTRRKR